MFCTNDWTVALSLSGDKKGPQYHNCWSTKSCIHSPLLFTYYWGTGTCFIAWCNFMGSSAQLSTAKLTLMGEVKRIFWKNDKWLGSDVNVKSVIGMHAKGKDVFYALLEFLDIRPKISIQMRGSKQSGSLYIAISLYMNCRWII